MDERPFDTSLRDLVAIPFRKKRDILLVIGATMMVGFLWLWVFRGETWEVSGKVLVRLGREQAPPPTMLAQQGVVLTDPQQYVNSESDLLHNRDLVARVVDRLGLAEPKPPELPPGELLPTLRYYAREVMSGVKRLTNETLIRLGARPRIPRRDAIIDELHEGLLVAPQEHSGVIKVRMFLPNRLGAATVLNTLLREYEGFRLELLADRGAVEFFRARTAETERALGEAEEALARFERAGATAPDDHVRILLTRIADGDAALSEAQLELRRAEARYARLEEERANKEPNFAAIGAFQGDPIPERLVAELTALTQERARLRLDELDSGVQMANNRERGRELIGYLSANLAAAVSERRAAYEGRARALRELRERLAALQNKQAEWAALHRTGRALEENYLFYRRKLEEASADQALTMDRLDNVTVIERAVDPVRPAGPHKLIMFAVICFFAVFAAAAWVAVSEFFDHRVHTAETLEQQLQLRVLASVPLQRNGGSGSRLRSVLAGEHD